MRDFILRPEKGEREKKIVAVGEGERKRGLKKVNAIPSAIGNKKERGKKLLVTRSEKGVGLGKRFKDPDAKFSENLEKKGKRGIGNQGFSEKKEETKKKKEGFPR